MPLLLKKNLKSKKARRFRTLLFAASTLSNGLTPVALANVIGADTQNFNPTTSGLDFVTVHSSETLEPGYLNFGLYLNQAVNSLPYYEDSPQGRTKFSDSVLGADLNIGIGLMKNWDLGLSLPQVLDQKAKADGFHGQFGQNGATEIRVNSKYRLLGNQEYGVAVVGSVNINRIKDNPFIGKDAGPTYNLELAADKSFNKMALAINTGYRWRKPGEALENAEPVEPLGNQIIASVAASYLFSSIDTKIIFEIFGSSPAGHESENSDRLASSAESLLGAKYDFSSNLAGHFGAGTELIHGRASPDWRIYTGLNWQLGPAFSRPQHPIKTAASGAETPTEFPSSDPFSGPVKAQEKIVIHDVLFEFDSDTLVVGEANTTLDRLVKYLMRDPVYTRLVIDGHTDSIGTDQYNMDLSRRRAITIKRWLTQRYKLESKKINPNGKGERFPIADNGNYQGRQLNRRVEFTIYRGEK
jgi:outer membrane protein OmpA-like peptidoglycan-associated protein